MKVTIESWKDVECDLRRTGVKDALYDEEGDISEIISRSGERYELSREVLKQLMESGMVEFKPGQKVGNPT